MKTLKKTISRFKILLLAKKNWTKPKKKEILIYDEASLNFLKNYFYEKDYEVLHKRNFPKRQINMFVIFIMLLKLKFSPEKYQEIYIKLVKPKFIITMIDNDILFYKIKSYYPNAMIISIQNAARYAISDIFSKIKKINDENKKLKADYVLVFNDHIQKIYKKIIDCKFLTIGSFVSNNQKKNLVKKNYGLVYISDFRDENNIPKEYISWEIYYREVSMFLKNLSKFLQKKKLKITILGATTGKQNLAEKKYYKKIFKNNKYKYLARSQKRPKFKIIDNAKFVLNINSTLGYEAFSRGSKTAFFSVRSKNKNFKSSQFNWPAKQTNQGLFWTNESSYSEISRILNYLEKISLKEWNKLIKRRFSDILKFDPGNKEFINFSKQIKLPLKFK